MKTLNDFNFYQKRVLVRCDFNVPIDNEGNILDDFRIKQTIPTIKYLLEKKAKIILMSHLGDPENGFEKKLSLAPVQKRLSLHLNLPVKMSLDCAGRETEELADRLESGQILLLENLRFHKEEKENDLNFAKELSKLANVYINDGFAACHRAHASVVGVPKFLPSGAGLLLEREISVLKNLIENSAKPLITIIGGKKAESKAKLIDKISEISDAVLLANLIEREIKEKNIELKFPDKIVEPPDTVDGKDIGPKTIDIFKEKISKAKTIFWAGPLGKIEDKNFQTGSREIAEAISRSKAFSVIGGGETVKFINKIGFTDKFSHVSTGGGALLDFICDGNLIGIESLEQ